MRTRIQSTTFAVFVAATSGIVGLSVTTTSMPSLVDAQEQQYDTVMAKSLQGVRESIRDSEPLRNRANNDLAAAGGVAPSNNSDSDADVDGRLHGDPDDCGFFDPIHHHLPCEDDVDSSQMTPAPVDGRDPITAKPSMQPTPAPVAPAAPVVPTAPTAPSVAPPSSSPGGDDDDDDDDDNLCKADDSGSYGQFGLVDNIVRVEYMYEMELTPGTTTEDIDSIILPSLERTFVNSIIPALFPDRCGRRQLLHTVRRRLKVIGISSNPADEVIPDVTCQALVSVAVGRAGEAPTCVVVDGEFMIFTDNGIADTERNIALKIMDEGMESGSYAETEPQVVRLQMIDGIGSTPPAQGPTSAPGLEGEENETDNNQNSVRVGLFVGLFGLVAILVGVVLRRFTRKPSDNESEVEPYRADNSQNVSVLTQSMQADEDAPPML